ncbi:hypothetical protein [Streptomyces qinzhouensis]|uniref:Transmembrane protein n=1 Tax=Streptomyces qinzhouensis TaxID=2599401 RepID=A0A5B8IGU8_9ACTN|nr:hypothetical protein [Streptomyces qinzhouensis]QDY77788.1 hypothetical protein FQU76_16205 [Streptomyces qinzhouensis]
MHMNSAPHLLSEDRAEFQRLLDEALRTAHERPDLAAIGERLNATQLRTMALNATALITASAAPEYTHYVRIREEARSPSPPAAARSGPPDPGGEDTDGTGAGLGAVFTVLAPVLAGTAALIFLLVGHLLKTLDPAPSFASPLVSAGWFFAALTAAAILAAAIGLLITAIRNSATQVPATERSEELPDEVARAKDAWLHAVLERGLLPFLRITLEDPSVDPLSPAPPRQVRRIPKVGYDSPDFSSPGDGATAGQRPTFTSPDFTSPDFGGPDHTPE